jgi:hypothetical protein
MSTAAMEHPTRRVAPREHKVGTIFDNFAAVTHRLGTYALRDYGEIIAHRQSAFRSSAWFHDHQVYEASFGLHVRSKMQI